MGRRKLKMEQIPKKGARMLAFHKRKEGLKKKLDELKTLCDVDACMIIYGPDSGADSEIYPNDLFATCRMINNYKSKKGDPGKCKTFGLEDFFQERQRKALEELSKLRKEAKFPTWHHTFDEEKDPLVLRDFARKLSAKSRYLKSRIEYMKEQGSVDNNQFPCFVFDGMGASCSTSYPQQYNHGHGVFMGEGPMICYNRAEGDAMVNPNVPALGNVNNEYQSEGDPFVMENVNNEYQREEDLFVMENVNEYQSLGDPFLAENDRGIEDYLLPFCY